MDDSGQLKNAELTESVGEHGGDAAKCSIRESSKPNQESSAPSNLKLAQNRSTLVHVLVGHVADRFGPWATSQDVTKTANRLLDFGRMAPVHRMSQLAFIETAATAYFHWFSPRGWTFVGYEQIHHGVAFDLVWARAGLIFADELKSGVHEFGPARSRLRSQVESQAEAGRLEWGDAFLGVRPVQLGSANSSHEIEEKDLVKA